MLVAKRQTESYGGVKEEGMWRWVVFGASLAKGSMAVWLTVLCCVVMADGLSWNLCICALSCPQWSEN
jgi:hypothetical protein